MPADFSWKSLGKRAPGRLIVQWENRPNIKRGLSESRRKLYSAGL
jgi:hypothetical protein